MKKVYCQNCNNKTKYEVLRDFKTASNIYDEFHWEHKYYIIQCLGCETIAFLTEYCDEDQWEFDEHTKQRNLYSEFTVYPEEPKKEPNIIQKENLVPKKFTDVTSYIYNIYIEVIKAYNSKSYFLSALGLRTIVEAMCKDCDISDGYVLNDDGEKVINQSGEIVRSKKLNGLINGLHENGHITFKQSNVLHQVRKLGNETTHDITFPRPNTILNGINVIEIILHEIYQLDKINITE
ncbi:DUF4145 domain-containing protein [Paenibacillus sp. B2(2019)]|uniref:DUF4145 domain-containing protein n=1 Tax=Paenibacillus sp. B2(2019) TaxID=2607754 RepID=UPI0011F17BA7|nr:DUF4145 domain-containing protein [Paenibacillus sp. B2(2019)]KAA1191120.1 DUF4145 domain-containing protein [Paenibacillus sp. B2(2019)]